MSGQFCDLPIINKHGRKIKIPPLRIRSGIFIMNWVLLGYCWWSVANFGRCPSYRSSGVKWRHPRSPAVFANKSRLKRATDMGVVSLSLFCHDASPDMQHDLLGSICDLRETLTWCQKLTLPIKVIRYMFDAPWREEHNGGRSRSLAFLVQKLFAKTFLT